MRLCCVMCLRFVIWFAKRRMKRYFTIDVCAFLFIYMNYKIKGKPSLIPLTRGGKGVVSSYFIASIILRNSSLSFALSAHIVSGKSAMTYLKYMAAETGFLTLR